MLKSKSQPLKGEDDWESDVEGDDYFTVVSRGREIQRAIAGITDKTKLRYFDESCKRTFTSTLAELPGRQVKLKPAAPVVPPAKVAPAPEK